MRLHTPFSTLSPKIWALIGSSSTCLRGLCRHAHTCPCQHPQAPTGEPFCPWRSTSSSCLLSQMLPGIFTALPLSPPQVLSSLKDRLWSPLPIYVSMHISQELYVSVHTHMRTCTLTHIRAHFQWLWISFWPYCHRVLLKYVIHIHGKHHVWYIFQWTLTVAHVITTYSYTKYYY